MSDSNLCITRCLNDIEIRNFTGITQKRKPQKII